MAVQLLSLALTEAIPPHDMVFAPGGTFPMGSGNHCSEDASARRVTIDSFFTDRTPVTNRAFRKLCTTGYLTVAKQKPALIGKFPIFEMQ